MINVPYRSQEDRDAWSFRNDCGPACAAMLKEWATGVVTPIDEISRLSPLNIADNGLTVLELQKLLWFCDTSIVQIKDVKALKQYIDQGSPVLCLIRYGYIPGRLSSYSGGHYVIATGYDNDYIYINDPDWYGTQRNNGKSFAVPYFAMMDALKYSPDPYKTIVCTKKPQTEGTTLVKTLTVLNIRATPSVSAVRIGRLDSGAVVSIRGSTKADGYTWAELVDQKGYIALEYTYPATVTYETLKAAQTMRIRDAAGLNSHTVGSLAQNSMIEVVIGQSIIKDGYVWRVTKDSRYIAERTQDNKEVYLMQPDIVIKPPTIKSKIGFHVHMDYQEGDKLISYAKAGLIGNAVVINNPDLCNKLVDAGVGIVVTRRVDTDHDPIPSIPQVEQLAIQAGYAYAQSRYNSVYSNTYRSVYMQFNNEWKHDPFDYAFEIGIMQFAESVKRKAIILNKAVGNPDGNDHQAKFLTYIPALQRAYRNGHIVGYHAYGTQNPPNAGPEEVVSQQFYSLRWHEYWKLLPDNAKPFMLYNECGTYDAKHRGVKPTVTSMIEFAKLLTFSEELGLAWWTLGGKTVGWEFSSIDGDFDAIMKGVKAAKT